MKHLFKKEQLKKMRALIGLILFSLVVAILNPRFLSMMNILNILRQTSINAIIAAGMTFVILTGGIDLSVGSVLAFTGAVAAALIGLSLPIAPTIFLTLLVGTLLGSATGLVVAKGKIQAFIATLVSMTILRGATLVFTEGRPITTMGQSTSNFFSAIGNGYFLGIPIPVYIMVFVFSISHYILFHTRCGRYVYAIGGNEEAARLSGLSTIKLKIAVYGISGFLASLSGIIMTARLSSAQPTAGTGYELDAIAAVVLGGTSLAGGVGTILGTLVGALIIGILNNALNLLNVSSYFQMIAKGSVILIAVLLDRKGNK